MSDKKIKLIRESLLESVVKDAITFATVIALIGVGIWAESSAMQWAGFLMFAILVVGRAAEIYDKSLMTPQQAADWLRDEYGVTASDPADGP